MGWVRSKGQGAGWSGFPKGASVTPQAELIAICGLDCAACDIYRASQDAAIAQKLTERFRSQGHPDAQPSWFHCNGCLGDRGQCWSGDCWIWQCCAGQRGLERCSACPEFPCQRLQEWAAKGSRYSAALERLKGMAAGEASGG